MTLFGEFAVAADVACVICQSMSPAIIFSSLSDRVAVSSSVSSVVSVIISGVVSGFELLNVFCHSCECVLTFFQLCCEG